LKTNPSFPPKFTPQPNGERDDLGPEAWDFTPKKVPKPEIVACLIYEYGRALAQLSRHSRVKGQADAAKVDFRELMRRYLPQFRRIAGRRFPDTAWQKLDKKIQLKFLGVLEPGIAAEQGRFREYVISNDDLRPYRIGLDALRRAQDDPFNFEDVSATRSHRKSRWQRVADIPRGRGGARDVLQWLGALRVRVSYKTTDLVDHTNKIVKVAAPYAASPDLYQRAKDAANLLALLSA
jgi:hypothetical protein